MSVIIQTSDFTGENQIATDAYTSDDLQTTIDTMEYNLLYEMLGVELATLFIDDLENGVPTTARFTELFDAWWKSIQDENVQSKGMKDMLVKYCYFYFVRTQSQNNTIDGLRQNDSSINQFSKMGFATLVQKYNDAIKTAQAIQTYIKANLSTYPEYNGDDLQYIAI